MIDDHAREWFEENYKNEVDPLLREMSRILVSLRASEGTIVRMAELTAELNAIAFKAGMKFEFQLGG